MTMFLKQIDRIYLILKIKLIDFMACVENCVLKLHDLEKGNLPRNNWVGYMNFCE